MSTDFSLGGPLPQAVGLALLHALWQGAIVAGVLAAVLALMNRRSATIRYVIACAALVLVFTMAVITGVRSYSPRSSETLPPMPAAIATGASADAVFIAASDGPASWQDVWMRAISSIRSYIPQIVMVWLAGVLLLTLRLAASWTRTRALASRGAVPAAANWQLIAARLSHALGLQIPIRLVISGGIDVPSVVGWLKPAILLPVSSFTGLTSEQLEMVLAHELAHIRRHDFLVNAIQSVIETLLFYHPAVWWLSRQIRIERENCCDDLAVSVCGDPLRYARALAQLEELRARPVLAVAANGGSLLDRIRRLVGAGSDRSFFSSGWTAAAAMVSFVTLVAMTAAPMLAARAQSTPAPPQAQAAPPRTPEPGVETTTTTEVTVAPDETDPEMDVDVDIDPVVVKPETPEVPEPAVAAPARIRTPRTPRTPRTMALLRSSRDDEESAPTPPGKLSIDELIALRVQGVTPAYIEQMRSIFSNVSLRDVIAMRVQGVTPDYVKMMRTAGLGELTAHEIIGLKVQDVTPDYVSQMRAAGVNVKNARDAVSLRVQGVTTEFVRSLVAAGYDRLTVRDLVRLAASGVNADFIREMSKYKVNK